MLFWSRVSDPRERTTMISHLTSIADDLSTHFEPEPLVRTLLVSLSRPSDLINPRQPAWPKSNLLAHWPNLNWKCCRLERLWSSTQHYPWHQRPIALKPKLGQMYDELRRPSEAFQRNVNKSTLNVKRKKLHAFAANDSAWHVQTIKYEPRFLSKKKKKKST